MLMFIVLLYFWPRIAIALPLQSAANTTSPAAATAERVGWTSTPQVRGTFDLLFSCLTTLFLCAWTAYHPNVQVGRSEWRKTAHRCVWMLIAVVLPEIVLWCAWEQWWAARKLMTKINGGEGNDEDKEDDACATCEAKICKESADDEGKSVIDGRAGGQETNEAPTDAIEQSLSNDPAKPSTPSPTQAPKIPWTQETAFFALSGGIALPHPDPTRPPLPLTPSGIFLLHRLHLLPFISAPAIADKSKADAIAKALVCVQAGWFLLQCIARAAKQLPVTSLEIHVLAHVGCAFAIYAFWWGKGYDVGQPMVVGGMEAADLGALFAVGGEDEQMSIGGEPTTMHCSNTSAPLTLSSIATAQQNPPLRRSSTRKYSNAILSYFEISPKPPRKKPISPSAPKTALHGTPELSAHLDSANRALELLKKHGVHVLYSSTCKLSEEKENDADVENGTNALEPIRISFSARYTVPTRSDLTIEGLDSTTKRTRQDIFIERQIKIAAILATAYASIHLLALSPSHFPTRIEHRLWLAATASMIVAPIAGMAWVFVIYLTHKLIPTSSSTPTPPPSAPSPPANASPIHARVLSYSRTILHWLVKCVLDTVWWLCFSVLMAGAVCYPFARLYLVVESFAGLRSVDGDVYTTVEWTEFIPHAG